MQKDRDSDHVFRYFPSEETVADAALGPNPDPTPALTDWWEKRGSKSVSH